METHLLGVNRLVDDVGDKLVGISAVVLVAIVAQCEIAEFHFVFPGRVIVTPAKAGVQSLPLA